MDTVNRDRVNKDRVNKDGVNKDEDSGVDEEAQRVVRLGAGGRLYQDARDAAAGTERKARFRRDKPKPEPVAVPPWTVSATGPEPVTVSAPRRDRRQGVSTLIECFGVILISGGVAIKWPWAGLVVLGIFVLLFGIAVGLPEKRPTT